MQTMFGSLQLPKNKYQEGELDQMTTTDTIKSR